MLREVEIVHDSSPIVCSPIPSMLTLKIQVSYRIENQQKEHNSLCSQGLASSHSMPMSLWEFSCSCITCDLHAARNHIDAAYGPSVEIDSQSPADIYCVVLNLNCAENCKN